MGFVNTQPRPRGSYVIYNGRVYFVSREQEEALPMGKRVEVAMGASNFAMQSGIQRLRQSVSTGFSSPNFSKSPLFTNRTSRRKKKR